ncbi:MAG: sigma-70 family RNA polymerase sigma factor [Bryobacteraceae bacterium]
MGTPEPQTDVASLLAGMKNGDSEALSKLIAHVYNDLRRVAAHCLRDERAGHTLQPTALVHEAYLRLVDQTRATWENRAQFMGVAAQIMRRILVDHARHRSAAKRGSGASPIDLDDIDAAAEIELSEELLTVDEALTRLSKLDPQQARVVEMRYFGGMTVEETAEALAIAPRTVKRDWAMAKAWLRVEFSLKDRA